MSTRVRAWTDTIVIPTYPLPPDDVNPRFFELEATLIYPYTMQDHLSRTKEDKSYRALFLENEYFKVICLPELGGRIHSVFDNVRGQEVFYRNAVIKPGLIALRGAWISGGIEWNRGPQSHTVTSFSPVDVVSIEHEDGSASLVIGYTEMNFRTGWEVRLTLHPGKAFLDERIRIFNPTDASHAYYFWNNTAFPNTPGTRFCYPMRAASDHDRFFPWPIDDGRDLRWLKNYGDATPVFAYQCECDFFGAYDVDRDCGLVQVADHRVLPGKKAWTWGQTDAGRTSQRALTDESGPYIEIQSGPLRTQTDYAVLMPGEEVAWQEWWYQVAGLGTGFEYATRDVAIERLDEDEHVEFRIAATASFPGARVELGRDTTSLLVSHVDLSPREPVRLHVKAGHEQAVAVTVTDADGSILASYRSPFVIPGVQVPAELIRRAPDPVTADDMYTRAGDFERQMDRVKARRWYARALEREPAHAGALAGMAALDAEAGLYDPAAERLVCALDSDSNNGMAWYQLACVRLCQDRLDEALACGSEAAGRHVSATHGLGVIGRVKMRRGEFGEALAAFITAHESAQTDRARVFERMLTAAHFAGESRRAQSLAEEAIGLGTTRLVPWAIHALVGGDGWGRFATDARGFVGEAEFSFLELSLFFGDLGRYREAADLLQATCVDDVSEDELQPLPLHYLAYFEWRLGNAQQAGTHLARAVACRRDYVFPSQPEAIAILQHAVAQAPEDGRAHLYLGNLFGGLGRLGEAVRHWELAGRHDPTLSVAFRNLGVTAWKRDDALNEAVRWLEQAIEARPTDQVSHRDLARVLIALDRRVDAIHLLHTMPPAPARRGDVTTLLARAYLDERRYDQALEVLDAATYSNWEGDIDNWLVFVGAHIERGMARLVSGDAGRALDDFDAALTYPEHLHVGRPSKPREARTQYWRGSALAMQGRLDEARAAWQAGAEGHPSVPEQEEFIAKCRAELEMKTEE